MASLAPSYYWRNSSGSWGKREGPSGNIYIFLLHPPCFAPCQITRRPHIYFPSVNSKSLFERQRMYISTATILPFLTLPLALAFPLPATDLALAIHKRGNNPSPPATRGFHILESDNFAALAKNEIRERSVG